MTVTVKLITEQTTNQLAASVNRAQADGWYPVCGIVYFNARYTQLMAMDSNGTEVPKCNYFIVDSEDGIDFSHRVNKHLLDNAGASCLSSVQYINARYIQSWGDDTLHHGGGGGSGGDALKWYTEDVNKTYPIIDVDPNLSQIGLGNEWAGYVQLLFRTGGNNAGYILADDGTMNLYKSDSTQLMLQDAFVNLLSNNVSVLNSDGAYTNLIANGSHVTLAPGYASINSPGGVLTLDETDGVYLSGGDQLVNVKIVEDDYTVNDTGGIREQINADRSVLVAPTGTADLTLAKEGFAQLSGQTGVTLNAANNKSVMEMDATATRFKRGTNQMLSMSDGGGAMTWNSIIRCAWNADGWNVSRDNGVSFTSRATFSAMMGPGDSRVETGTSNVMLTSNSYSTTAGKIDVTNTSLVTRQGTSTSTVDSVGFTKDTNGEYHYKIDGSLVFFSSGDITEIGAGNSGIVVDNGAGIFIGTHDNMPVSVSGGPLVPSSTETLGTPAKSWDLLYLDSSTPRVVQTASAYTTPDATTIAKMANLIPQGINTAQGYMTMGYMYEDVILAFGTVEAELYGLAWMEDGKKIVNPVAILAMEALYVRSKLS